MFQHLQERSSLKHCRTTSAAGCDDVLKTLVSGTLTVCFDGNARQARTSAMIGCGIPRAWGTLRLLNGSQFPQVDMSVLTGVYWLGTVTVLKAGAILRQPPCPHGR